MSTDDRVDVNMESIRVHIRSSDGVRGAKLPAPFIMFVDQKDLMMSAEEEWFYTTTYKYTFNVILNLDTLSHRHYIQIEIIKFS